MAKQKMRPKCLTRFNIPISSVCMCRSIRKINWSEKHRKEGKSELSLSPGSAEPAGILAFLMPCLTANDVNIV